MRIQRRISSTENENISPHLTSSFPKCNFAREIPHISFRISCICESKTIVKVKPWSWGHSSSAPWQDQRYPGGADAIAAATVQTSVVIVYTLYDSSWSQDSCIRTSKSNRVVYNDRFSLVSVNVRVKLQWLQLERSENQQPIPGPRMRL